MLLVYLKFPKFISNCSHIKHVIARVRSLRVKAVKRREDIVANTSLSCCSCWVSKRAENKTNVLFHSCTNWKTFVIGNVRNVSEQKLTFLYVSYANFVLCVRAIGEAYNAFGSIA